jgi:hypothetical protein
MSDQPVERQLPNTNRHPCLKLDLNPRSQRSRERRQSMPYTLRPLLSDVRNVNLINFVIKEFVCSWNKGTRYSRCHWFTFRISGQNTIHSGILQSDASYVLLCLQAAVFQLRVPCNASKCSAPWTETFTSSSLTGKQSNQYTSGLL